MAISAVISNNINNINATITPQDAIAVTQYRVDYSTITLGDLTDLDLTENSDGAMLTYVGSTTKWEAKTTIQNANTIINGGYF